VAVVAFIVTYAFTPWLIRALLRTSITVKDLHKKGTPDVPTMGGIGVFVGVAAALTVSGALNLDYRFMFAIFLSGTLAALGGIVDDLFKLSKVALVGVTLLVGLPVVAFQAGSTLVYLTPFGPKDLGWLFWALVPFAFAFLMNGVNIYSGFNGLEAGLALVSSMSLGACAFLYGSWESAASLFALSGALLAFLKWNWDPARLLIGNSGTLLVGAIMAASIVTGTIKVAGVIALFPYIINFIMRARDRFKSTVADAQVLPDGRLKMSKTTALWAVFIRRSPAPEKTVVIRCMLVQIAFGISAVIFAYFHANFIVPRF
jgi:UDP-N-acetylmuramyl pentapeptide phosphotransferase/UDP-N-acetylglucosamine-1-phosphate transferase